jgi:hypothetical protein
MSCFDDLMPQGLGCSVMGGVREVYIGIWSGTTAYDFDAMDVVTGVTGSNVAYEYAQESSFAGLSQTSVINADNKSFYVESVLTLKFAGGVSTELRKNWLALSKAPLVAFIVSNEGTTYVAGVEAAGLSTEGSLGLGVALGDLNGGTISIRFQSNNGIYLMDNALLGTDITVVNA